MGLFFFMINRYALRSSYLEKDAEALPVVYIVGAGFNIAATR
jgi:hypothetical protein